jgi:hypothetical protein
MPCVRIFVSLLLLLAFTVHAQEPEKLLQQFSERYPQEKVVLQFSKPAYLAGESIYFKAYVLNGYEPSLLSTNLYAELYDKDKNLLQKQLILLQKGSGNGRFALPASLAEDVYYIRAYTQWMRNFDRTLWLPKPIPVYNPYSSQVLRAKKEQWAAKAIVENGMLVEGAPARVAVRLSSPGTLPQGWSGQLLEQETNNPVTNLAVYNSEIGQVRFIPQEGKTYKILLRDSAGKKEELLLPPPQKSGVVLQATSYAGQLRYSILFRNIASAGKGYKIVAAFNNEPVMTATITKSPGEISGTMDISKLPAGVLQLTLFNEQNSAVAERLCFLHQDKLQTVTPTVYTDTFSIAPKGYNHWRIETDTASLETYNVIVSDAALWQPGSFLSAVYLTSDFSSPVHNAEWYFTDVTPEKMSALDALLLTKKWNRFQWSDLLQNRVPVIRYQPDSYLNFTGTVWKGKKPQPFRDINLVLQAADSTMSFVQVKTDSAGRFALNQFYFTDSLRVFFQPNKRKLLESDLEISFTQENKFAPLEGDLPPAPFSVGSRAATDTVPLVIQRALAQRTAEMILAEKTKMLEAVVITTNARSATEELERQLVSGPFAGGNADVFDFVNERHTITGVTNILQWLQGRVAGFSILYGNGVLIPRIRNGPVQLFLDEMAISLDMLESLNPNDIALLKVFRNNFVGSFGGGAAIAIYTRRGGMGPQYIAPSLPSYVLPGYARFPPPAGPDYSLQGTTEIKDQRVVLSFQHLLQTESEGIRSKISFHNNDSAKQYRLVITGFTREGRLVYLNKLIPPK